MSMGDPRDKELEALRAENTALKTEIATRIERIEAMTVLLCQEAAQGQGMMGKPFQDFIDQWRASHDAC